MEKLMKQPPCFNDGSGRVCKLQRALYGLKQAPRAWRFTPTGAQLYSHWGPLFIYWSLSSLFYYWSLTSLFY
ncbi:hypothetical protein T05_1335 [Trichinella murrelli]|uniref:Reverse transcriptase Ty1/copia-type domain-containing protein n=1 Tax=Trichinella murrelli TaxID=144512 RepID=A0A0V0T3G3_9BILA|nr:hypothetical protein T05_1335 [Trichinella murrelli]